MIPTPETNAPAATPLNLLEIEREAERLRAEAIRAGFAALARWFRARRAPRAEERTA